MAMNLMNRLNSTTMNNQNKNVRAVGFNQRKYSTKRVVKKYNKPMEKNNIAPLINSLV